MIMTTDLTIATTGGTVLGAAPVWSCGINFAA